MGWLDALVESHAKAIDILEEVSLGAHGHTLHAGVIDPVQVCYTALQNAGSVAALILTTQTLIAKIPDDFDPTAGPALGGGAELLGLD